MMINTIRFRYRSKTYSAKVILSLEEDDCYIFAFLIDKELIDEFGRDIDITTDCYVASPEHMPYPKLEVLKNAILEAAKELDEFKQFKLKKLIIRKEQLN